MVMDITRCNGCYNCFLACRDEFTGNDFPPYSASQPKSGHYWMRLIEKERGQYPKVKVAYIATPCMQCQEPPCVEVARGGAAYRRADGIVMIDPVKAADQRQIVDSCPYRVVFWNEERRVAQKCTFCAHLLDAGWKEPRCAEACPTQALIFGDLDDPESEVSRLVAAGHTEELHGEYGLGAAVRYIGLPKRFVAGAVVFGDTGRCGEGAEVTLESVAYATQVAAGRAVGKPHLGDAAPGCAPAKLRVLADNYGDFEFEGLAAHQVYRVTVVAPGYEARELTARTDQDLYLGDIVLERAGAAAGAAGATPGVGPDAAQAGASPPGAGDTGRDGNPAGGR
jgi:Fe-S-cluster-containing dehydrogenase component